MKVLLYFVVFLSQASLAIEMGTLNFIHTNIYLESDSNTQQFNVFELRAKNEPIGTIYSIAGEPQLQKTESLANGSKDKLDLKILYYDAGTAGTTNFSQIDRLAIFYRGPGEKKWKQLGDQAIAIRRYTGSDLMLNLERVWSWDPEKLILSFSNFDEFTAINYFWDSNKKSFVTK